MSIRKRLATMTFASTAVLGTFSYLAYDAFSSYSDLSNQVQESIMLEDLSVEIKNSSLNSNHIKVLQKHRENLKPPHRMEALSDVIQSYADRNSRLLNRRVDHFVANEREYRKFVQPQLPYYADRVKYFGILSLVTMALTLFGGLAYLNAGVFEPLRQLSQKMIDFLNDRYTYQFSVPAPNEVGNLQSTFNSLAQRVLANMEDLQSLDKAKSEFLSIASHELRTPLTSIKGSLSLLKSGVAGTMNEATNRLLSIAGNETDRLIRLINDLLDLAKIEARKLPLNKEWHSLDLIVKNAFEGLDGLAKTAGVQLVQTDPSRIKVLADKDRIHQVLTNLLSNAVKYSERGKSVDVEIEICEDQKIEIRVIDHGKGIAPEDQELIFQKFRQATSPKNPLVKGTGLGLAIAKALVEEHAGNIGVRSNPGHGSVFYFTLKDWALDNQIHQLEPYEVAA